MDKGYEQMVHWVGVHVQMYVWIKVKSFSVPEKGKVLSYCIFTFRSLGVSSVDLCPPI